MPVNPQGEAGEDRGWSVIHLKRLFFAPFRGEYLNQFIIREWSVREVGVSVSVRGLRACYEL